MTLNVEENTKLTLTLLRLPHPHRVALLSCLTSPPLLSDGKTVRFDYWEIQIRHKLRGNADHFLTPDDRIYYVSSRTEGKAQLHVQPRMKTGASNPYGDADDMIRHLESVFSNPNRVAEALHEYNCLTMKPKDDFNDFLADFVRLAEEAKRPEDDRLRGLHSKLPSMLQTQSMYLLDDPNVNFA
ncbi:hypothetical protein PENDEC_c002G01036 [Penicillium decumbens]|uniref:Uncharacterized protein n=1 Tax=Penicillium decumbens TaxID=69771 RepID=A0A1V6PL10_PENDC|nr:hypothetical protein PENDEC_c002G01036 [Penicillium decumbens]